MTNYVNTLEDMREIAEYEDGGEDWIFHSTHKVFFASSDKRLWEDYCEISALNSALTHNNNLLAIQKAIIGCTATKADRELVGKDKIWGIEGEDYRAIKMDDRVSIKRVIRTNLTSIFHMSPNTPDQLWDKSWIDAWNLLKKSNLDLSCLNDGEWEKRIHLLSNGGQGLNAVIANHAGIIHALAAFAVQPALPGVNALPAAPALQALQAPQPPN